MRFVRSYLFLPGRLNLLPLVGGALSYLALLDDSFGDQLTQLFQVEPSPFLLHDLLGVLVPRIEFPLQGVAQLALLAVFALVFV